MKFNVLFVGVFFHLGTMVKKLTITFIAALLIIAAALTIVPQFINWSSYKPTIISAVQNATGRMFTVDGDIEVTMFPELALKISRVRFANVAGAVKKDMLVADDMRMGIAFGDLLKGRLRLVVTLNKPVVALEVTKEGNASWDFVPKRQVTNNSSLVRNAIPEKDIKTNSSLNEETRPFDLQLDKFLIKKGALTFLDGQTGKMESVTNLNSEVSFASLKGPFFVKGEAELHKYPLIFDIAMRKVEIENAMAVAAKLHLSSLGSKVALDGVVDYSTGSPSLKGTLSASAENFATMYASLTGITPKSLAKTFVVSGQLRGGLSQIKLSAANFKLGSMQAEGETSLSWSDGLSGSLRFTAESLDFDELLVGLNYPVIKKTGSISSQSKEKGVEKNSNGESKSDPSGFRAVIPSNIDFTITAFADSIKYRSELLRQASARIRLVNGKLKIQQIGVLLPGDSSAGMAGTVQFLKGKPFANIRIQAKSKRLRNLLSWAGIELHHIPPSRLRSFSLEMILFGSAPRLKVHSIKSRLDNTNIRGGLSLVISPKIAFGARLSIDRLNLDSYLQNGVRPVTGQAPSRQNNSVYVAETKTPSNQKKGTIRNELAKIFSEFNANIAITIQDLLFKKNKFTNVNADLSVIDGLVTAKRISVRDFAGASAAISGRLFGPKGTEAPSIGFNVTVNDSKRLFKYFGGWPPAAVRRAGKFSAKGTFSGDFRVLKLNTIMNLGGTEAKLRGEFRNLLNELGFDVRVGLSTLETGKFAKIFEPNYRVVFGRLGPSALTFHAGGDQNQLLISDIKGNISKTSIAGTAALKMGHTTPRLKMNLSFGDLDFDRFQNRNRKVMNTATKSRNRIQKLKRPYSRRKSPVGKNPIGVHPRWSRKKFSLELLKNIESDFNVRIERLRFSQAQFNRLEAQGNLNQGILTLKTLKARMGGGSFVGSAKFDVKTKIPKLSLSMNAENVLVNKLIPELEKVRINAGPFRLGGKIIGKANIRNLKLLAQGSSTAEIISSLNGAGRVDGILNITLSKGSQNINNAAGIAAVLFGNKVKGLGTVGRVSKTTNRLIGYFGNAPNKFLGDLTIVNGTVSTQNLQLLGRGAVLLTAGDAALSPWQIQSNSQVIETGRKGEAFITAAVRGDLDRPKVKVGGRWLKAGKYSRTPTQTRKPSQPSTSQGTPTKPQDIFKGIFKP